MGPSRSPLVVTGTLSTPQLSPMNDIDPAAASASKLFVNTGPPRGFLEKAAVWLLSIKGPGGR